jgi:hypothetical protein
MTTADSVQELALSLARLDVERGDAVRKVESACGGRRVAVVRARQMMMSSLEDDPEQLDTPGAIAILDDLLARLPA